MKFGCLVVLIPVMLLGACGPTSSYEKLVERELATGVRNDSLFLGLHFGMGKQDFFDACWAMNKQGLLRQGDGNQSVRHEIDYLPFPASLNFYPRIEDDIVVSMPCVFVYDGWAPWNEEMSGDSMALHLQEIFLDWYGGNAFETTVDPKKGRAFYKVDGNRQITILPQDELVRVLIKDLTVESNRNPNPPEPRKLHAPDSTQVSGA